MINTIIIAAIILICWTDAVRDSMVGLKREDMSDVFHLYKWVSFFTAEGMLSAGYMWLHEWSYKSIATVLFVAMVCSVSWRIIYNQLRNFINKE